MALKNTLDAADVGARLARWLPEALHVDGPVEVTGVEIPHASGMSSETVLCEASWSGAKPVGLVVRVPPERGLFPDYDIAREAKTMSALAEYGDAPVPRVLAHESSAEVLGAEFLLIERHYGRVPGDDPPFVADGWVLALDPAERSTMYDSALRALSGIQRVDPVTAGLSELRRGDASCNVLEEELAYWRAFYGWAGQDRQSPLIEAALERMETTRPVAAEDEVVVWGDARFGNMMFGSDNEVTAVLDWELASIGPREVDFAYFLFFDRMYSEGIGVPRLAGFPERDIAVARFEELIGRAVRDLDWFEAFAALRGSILLLRVGNLMIEYGQLPEDAPLPVTNPAALVLASLLDLPAPDGEAGWITGNR